MSVGSLIDWDAWLQVPREALERDREVIERFFGKHNTVVKFATVPPGTRRGRSYDAIVLMCGDDRVSVLGQTPSEAATKLQKIAIDARKLEDKWSEPAGKGRARGSR